MPHEPFFVKKSKAARLNVKQKIHFVLTIVHLCKTEYIGANKIMDQKNNRMNATSPTSIDEYIAGFPEEVQLVLEQVRATIKAAAPNAEETIAYAMPAYKLNGPLVYFAGHKRHIGFYATPTGHEAFAKELSVYQQGKGSVQFPLDQPMPLDLIARIVKFRVGENLAKPKKSGTKKINK